MSKNPVSLRLGPPRIGQHSREALTEAGLSPSEIDQLAAIGAIRLEEPAQ